MCTCTTLVCTCTTVLCTCKTVGCICSTVVCTCSTILCMCTVCSTIGVHILCCGVHMRYCPCADALLMMCTWSTERERGVVCHSDKEMERLYSHYLPIRHFLFSKQDQPNGIYFFFVYISSCLCSYSLIWTYALCSFAVSSNVANFSGNMQLHIGKTYWTYAATLPFF